MAVGASTRVVDLPRLVERDIARLIHPHCGPDERARMVVAEGEGCLVRDAGGREYLDMTGGGLWANLVGHGRRELAQAAAVELERLGFFCSFWDFTNEPAIELADRLAAMAPDRLERVFFTCGGSEGIELAIKIARLHHHLGDRQGKDWILGRRQSYHGIGHAGGSASSFDWLREGYGPLLPHFSHLTPAWPYREELFDGRGPTEFLVDELESKIAELGPDRIAAFIGEPIMGVGGLLVPPDDYWPRIAEVLERNDILLILDEVVTGYGRMGDWFAAQHYGVEPDLLVSAKGITSGYFPFGAVLMSGEIADRITAGDHGFPLGYTYTGHAAGAAVATANLDLIEHERLRESGPRAGERLRAGLESLLQLPTVGDVRGVGLLAGLELVRHSESREPMPAVDGVTSVLREEHGVIVRAALNSSLVFSPALVIRDEEVDRCISALADVLERTSSEGEVA